MTLIHQIIQPLQCLQVIKVGCLQKQSLGSIKFLINQGAHDNTNRSTEVNSGVEGLPKMNYSRPKNWHRVESAFSVILRFHNECYGQIVCVDFS